MLCHTFDIKLFSLLKMLRVTLDKLLNIFLTPLLKALAKETTLFFIEVQILYINCFKTLKIVCVIFLTAVNHLFTPLKIAFTEFTTTFLLHGKQRL